MSNFNYYPEAFFIGVCLEGFFWGLYSAIFIIYLQDYISKQGTSDNKKTITIFYSHCDLYVLSGVTLALDMAWFIVQYLLKKTDMVFCLIVVTDVFYGLCNFLSQCILIYRCWIVWDLNIYVVIIPSILTFAFLPIWLTATTSGTVLHINK